MVDRNEARESGLVERTSIVILAVAALAIAGIMVRREFWPRGDSANNAKGVAATRIENFAELINSGIRIGNPRSRATIVEFADFECPFCRQFHETYSELKQRFGDDLSLVFLHYPLQSHRFARPAARAAECAEARGEFDNYARLLFLKQDSLGLKSWSSFALEAGIQDTLAFSRCASDTVVVRRVENGLALGKAIGLRGTPTLIINGMMYAEPPSSAQLRAAIEALLDGPGTSKSGAS